jgi:hypothetical protein
MTRSIFDPTGGETERSGSRNLGPDAGNLSHMPPDVVDGKADPSEQFVDPQLVSQTEAENPKVDPDNSVRVQTDQHRPCADDRK